MPVPDPARSRAVLIGIGAYSHPDLADERVASAAAEGAKQLAALLHDPSVWGLPIGHITEIGAEATAEQVLAAVRDAAEQASDTILVYFAGHGLRDREQRLHLALREADADLPQIGGLRYTALRDVLRASAYGTRYRITMLDCCFSGLAGELSAASVPGRAELAHALEEPTRQISDTGDYGAYVLTSAPPSEPSFVRPGEPIPEFTGELLRILKRGIPNGNPLLSLNDIWKAIRNRLQERGSPEPQQFVQNSVAHQVCFRNHAPAPKPHPWYFHLGEVGFRAGLAVSDGITYVSDDKTCLALDAATGNQRWAHMVGSSSRLTATNGMVYIGALGSVRALDSSTGAERWRFEDVGHVQDISIEDGTVYAQTLEADYALNAATGALHWSRSDISMGISAKPTRMVSGGTLYAVGGKAIHALDAITGKIRWSHPLGRKSRFSSLTATSEGVYCQAGRRILALDANTGNTQWTQEDISSNSLLTDGIALYAAREKHLHALDVRTGAIKWTTKSKSPLSLLAATNGLVYACTNELHYGRIHAFESSTGSVHWRSNLPYTALDKLIISYGMAYVCNHSGYRPDNPDPVSVYAINASTGASTYYAWNDV